MRSGDTLLKIVAIVIFLALLAYMGFAALDRFINPLETAQAVSLTVEDALEITGYAARDEIVLDGSDSFVVVVPDGTKVSVGQELAVEYGGSSSLERASRIKELKDQITQLENSLIGKRTEAELASDSVISLSRAVQSGDMSDVELAVIGVKTYIMGMYGSSDSTESVLDQLHTELNNLERESASDTSYIRSEYSGIFTSVVDGYENVSPDDLTSPTPSSVKSLFSGGSADSGAIGKLVTGIDWCFVSVIDEADADRISGSGSWSIQFKNNFGESVNMKVKYISPAENGKCAVVFSSNKFVSDISSLRELVGDITFSSYTGIRVPKSAVYYDEDGSAYVYVLASLQARRADITIKEEVGDFFVVDVEEGSLLRVGADIIVKAKDLSDGKVVK